MSNGRTHFPMLPLSAIGIELLDCEHWTPKPSPEGFPYIAIPDIRNGHIDLANVRLISKEDHQSWTKKTKPQAGDIIVTRRGRVGDTAVVPKGLECAIGQDLVILRSDETHVLQSFLRWALRGPLYEREVQKYLNVGAIFDSLNCGDIPKFEIPVPSIPEQSAISNVLDALDSKIELNHQMNRTLEAIGHAVFERWFVDFEFPNEEGKPYKSSGGEMAESEKGEIPKAWRIGELSSFGKIVCGKTPPKVKKDFFGGNVPFIKIPDMHNQLFIIDTEDTLTDEGKRYQMNKNIPPNSICASCIATVGLVSITARESQTNQQINCIIPNEEFYLPYLFYTMKSLKRELEELGSGGSATLNVNTSTFSNIRVIDPKADVLEEFYKTTIPLLIKMRANLIESQTLSQIRDCLLPKLMSGKIRVPVTKENAK
jgi:type I restriction enzyme S subunit